MCLLSVDRKLSDGSDDKARFQSRWGVVGPGSESQGCAETPVYVYIYIHLINKYTC